MPIFRRALLRYSLSLASSVYVSTALSGCSLGRSAARLDAVSFPQGVASGDPEADAVMLWTRATPPGGDASVRVGWEVARDDTFREVLRSGEAVTGPARDYTVKVDVRDLAPGSTYYYRFLGLGTNSMIGRARTLPAGPVDQVRLAIFSCSNYPAGYFHAYAEAARLADVDAFVHLGDYIYEYGDGGYATERSRELGRALPAENSGELYTLEDYRARYALYRSDSDLQAVHASAPMIAVWDDHEIANDTWKDGAQNHSSDEGDFAARRRAAVQAYFEWMPLRPVVPDEEGRIYRSFRFGDLVDLHMLDTRLVGRDEQLDYSNYTDSDTRSMQVDAFLADIGHPERSLLGEPQRNWLYGALQASEARWQVLGQQILMARMTMPAQMLGQLFGEGDLTAAAPLIEALTRDKAALLAGEPLSAEARRRLAEVLPYNLDAWDGYPAERERLYAVAGSLGKSLVVLAGDTHNAWYSELLDRSGQRVGVELATSSVSSPGMESYLGLDAGQAESLARSLAVLIDELQLCELQRRGFLEVTFGRDDLQARWHFIDSVWRRDYAVEHRDIRISA